MSDENLNLDDFNFFEGEDETYEVVTLTENDGSETDFFVIDGVDVENERYLLLVKAEDFEKEEPEAFLFKEIESDGDDFIYEPVEDEAEYNKIIVLLQDEDTDYEMKF